MIEDDRFVEAKMTDEVMNYTTRFLRQSTSVGDRSRRQLVVMPAPADARALVGRVVTIRRATDGRLVIQPDGLGKGLYR